MLDDDDPGVRRLSPAAYRDDAERSAEFEQLVGGDLRAERLERIDLMERTIDAERLTEDEALAWLNVLNDLRLILGTRLDITEELDLDEIAADDPLAPAYQLYGYLTWLVGHLVEALPP